MRPLAALAMLVAAFVAAPASAQIDKGCYNYSGQNVWTAKSADKLRADIECFKKAKGLADISIANREKRIAQLTPVAPPVGDVQEPELGVSLDKVPAPVASNFDVASMLVPSWGSGAIAVSGAAEGVGAFRFNCNPGQLLRDDPIVFPKQPGKSHLHQFFGNLTADANSTYASLRAKGDSTCGNPLNRSAYWSPAMLDGKGNVVQWDYAQIYYKRSPSSSEGCAVVATRCEGIPRGLRQIFGYDMVTGKTPTGSVYWKCDGPTAPSGAFPTLADVATVCRAGNYITVSSSSPTCWDGKRLDSPNHRDHLAYADFGNTGKLRCPATHPVGIPAFSLQLFYRVVDGDNPTEWSLSSDDMTAMGMGKLPAGTSFHTDLMDAWDDDIKHVWIDNCIEKLLSCNGNDLGNGKQLKDVWGFKWKIEPRVVPIPEAR
ncbi:MAG: DUF1996 domain-containing protein [Sphingomonas phyllosphaerae]|uniref:DUF1996 domain-containing protein n=1 Tax=Sphingomonas phyllosphaerae TaxID=257003 RepID=UPI002FF796B7